jgi:PQQ-dependent catabolism-associated CXXCW motif protein
VNRRWLLVALLAAPALVGGSARGQQTPPREPHAYRTDHYRAPTPRTLRGARVVSTSQAAALWKQGEAVFVDVLPRPPRPVDLPAGTIWRDRPRFDIPGSIWLPDTGYGALASSMQDYFAAGLRKATHRDRDKPVVIYCLRNCWMSWNAAKRALAMHYTHVIWYPDGTDGWADAGLPLKRKRPEPRPQE